MNKNTPMPIQLTSSVFCLLGHTNIGIIEDKEEIIIIDSGLNSENASEIDEVFNANVEEGCCGGCL